MTFLQNHWWLVLTMAISGALLLFPLLTKGVNTVAELTAQGAVQLANRRNALFLDLREDKNLTGKKLPKALHIPFSSLNDRSNELKRYQNRPIIFYGDQSLLAYKAHTILKELGCNEIFHLRGGLNSWLDAGFPLVHQTSSEKE